MPQVDQTGFFIQGCDSLNDPAYLGQNNYAWGINGMHRGGNFRTRPGLVEIGSPFEDELGDINHPQGFTVFVPINKVPHFVMAHGGRIYVSPYPFTEWRQLPELSFFPYRQVVFESGMKSVTTNADGTLTFLRQPYPVLLIEDGISYCGYWDGTTAAHSKDIPIASYMRWSGSRMWFADENRLHAGDEADPLALTEEKIVASGGFFTLPGDITGIGETPDLRSLLVFTDTTTTTFQSSILNREQWRQTPDFQKLLFLTIGCTSHKGIVNQYGLTWWPSHGGVIALDNALQTYRSSSVHYRDHAMARSKSNLATDLSRICSGAFENVLVFSMPSGDWHNAHTWVRDQTVLEMDSPQSQSSWAGIFTGIRPVEWVTAVINGQNRCFVLSRDYGSDPTRYRPNIWEAFSGERVDARKDGTATRIRCGFETRMLAFSAEPKRARGVEIDIGELFGIVDVRIWIAGRRSGYVQIGEKRIVATEGSIGGPVQVEFADTDILSAYLPQQRVIRTNEIELASIDRQVQSQSILSRDLGFSVYVEWDGQMSIRSIRFFYDPDPDAPYGRCEPDEDTERLVDSDGSEEVTTVPATDSPAHALPSAFIDSVSSKLPEFIYSSSP